ncbi:hypothetical protein PV10_02494 [Exophiala mesophila]|uniref:Sas10 C-terminal domain-containing protein n=1 Tax=Exophiala mesophila TaxID=212818 RepID=A0A0D1ZJF3_EXOME|nr:uncharacterized protein PV10_02494 [Exophiala mesophila]KIV94762.1 hypothetical protein PV10_02494 [Exophiala mesophila]
MAVDTTAALIQTLTTALEATTAALPQQQDLIQPEGISLFDTKNDLLLSYLQNLVFLIVLRLRQPDETSSDDLLHQVISKLVQQRVYLERGVRPLQGKLKYQVDKVVRAAEEAQRRVNQKTAQQSVAESAPNGDDASDSDDSDADSDDPTTLKRKPSPPTEETSHGPRPGSMRVAGASKATGTSRSADKSTVTGAYKPPRNNPTLMPEDRPNRERDQSARKRRSKLLDEYIDEEVSTAPQSQPSIGAGGTITQQGRGAMSSRERERERERTDYEERNFVRLPAMTKAERKKEKARTMNDKRDLFGGEDWTGLGGLGDRINRTVAGKGRAADGPGLFERRDKRRRETIDGPRGDGAAGPGIGDTFEKRRKILQGRADKKNRRRA